MILLAPDAQRYTWDVIRDFRDDQGTGKPRFGEDTLRVDAALKQAFEQFTIDPRRVAIGGFSDGASYALSLGPRNDAVFSHIMAFSPGGVAPFETAAHARVFISHGRQDPMLPFKNTAEGIVPGFRARGFDVTFETFNGVHDFRDAEIAKAMDWFLAVDRFRPAPSGPRVTSPGFAEGGRHSSNSDIWLPLSFSVGGWKRSWRRLNRSVLRPRRFTVLRKRAAISCA